MVACRGGGLRLSFTDAVHRFISLVPLLRMAASSASRGCCWNDYPLTAPGFFNTRKNTDPLPAISASTVNAAR